MTKLERSYFNVVSPQKKLPDLGDPTKVFSVELTEPEINCLYAIMAFVNGAQLPEGFDSPFAQYVRKWHEHYGPTMQTLDEKLRVFDGK